MLFDRILEKITDEKESRLFADICESKTSCSSMQNLLSTPNGFFTPKMFFKGLPITNQVAPFSPFDVS